MLAVLQFCVALLTPKLWHPHSQPLGVLTNPYVQHCWVPRNVLPKNGHAGIFLILRACQARNLKTERLGQSYMKRTNLAFCTALKCATLIADKDTNQLESIKLRTVLGDTGPHVIMHPTVL